MATLAIVKKAILDMKDRTGSSLIAINKWILTNEKVRRRMSAIALFPFPPACFFLQLVKTNFKKPHTFCASLRNGGVDFFGTKPKLNMRQTCAVTQHLRQYG